jgi:histone H4
MVAIKRKSKSKTKGRSKKRGASSKKKLMDDESYYGSGISDGAIRRLARRGGIKRISADSFQEVRGIYLRFLDVLVTHAVAYTECAQRKTVRAVDVIYALKKQGRNLYGYIYDEDVSGHNAITHDTK